QPFVRLDTSRSRETGGLGLGLTIARDVVLSHGGQLTLDASKRGGLKAVVRLPT
ncbi:MAG: ATP-binding protein, partial [Reyranellaceae bacterium]